MLNICIRHREEHGIFPAEHHPRAITNVQLAARHVRNAGITLQRMLSHLCLVCGSPLEPLRARD